MKTLGLILIAAGLGVGTYGGYKYYQQKKSLGNLSTGSSDHNSKFAQAYWQQQASIRQNIKTRQLNDIARQRQVF